MSQLSLYNWRGHISHEHPSRLAAARSVCSDNMIFRILSILVFIQFFTSCFIFSFYVVSEITGCVFIHDVIYRLPSGTLHSSLK